VLKENRVSYPNIKAVFWRARYVCEDNIKVISWEILLLRYKTVSICSDVGLPGLA
jgi:hypothetical protein